MNENVFSTVRYPHAYPQRRKGHYHSAEKIQREGTVFFSRNSAKNAGEAVFVLDKSHLKAVNRVLTCVGFQASTQSFTYRPVLTGLNKSFFLGGGGG